MTITTKLIKSVIVGMNIILLFAVEASCNPVEKVVKIPIAGKKSIAELSQSGLDILVIENDYMLARAGAEKVLRLKQNGFSILPVKEKDFVWRLIKIPIANRNKLNKVLSNPELDIWEIQKDYIIAQVLDKQIRVLKEKGFSVKIIRKNALDILKDAIRMDESEAGLYHSYSEITSGLLEIETSYPDIAKVYDIGDSVEGRNILAIKLSDNPSQNEDEPKILFLGCHHAREWISVDVPFYLAKTLAENYAADQQVRDFIDGGEIWIVPMFNPDGHEYCRTNYRLWRKNTRDNGDGTFGIDLNRNYDYMWGGSGSSGDTSSYQYRGPSAFSEPETQAIRDLMLNNQFDLMLTYHSYSQLILFSWGYTTSPSPDHVLLSGMAQEISDLIHNVHSYSYTPMQSSSFYVTSGDTTDWTYGSFGIPSFTIELRPSSSGGGGFLLPEDQIMPTFEENWPAALYLIGWTQQDDIDEDGVINDLDNCRAIPNGPGLGTCSPGSSNAGSQCTNDNECGGTCTDHNFCSMNQENGDTDGYGDVCDNCPENCNSQQLDADGDEAGDVCDDTPGCGGCSLPVCEQEC